MTLVLTPLKGIPLIHPGDDINNIIINGLIENNIILSEGDIVVVTQKIISKAEGRLINLQQIEPSDEAIKLAGITNKDPRLVELIITESNSIIRAVSGTLIVEHKCGFICANAGIDHSNVQGDYGNPGDWYLLLPENPDSSAKKIRMSLENYFSTGVGVLVIDSHGRPWRNGTIGMTIGISGLPALVDMIGKEDIFGYKLLATQVGVADELASAASLLMGQSSESIPVVHVHGFPYPLRESSIHELIRNKNKDLFR